LLAEKWTAAGACYGGLHGYAEMHVWLGIFAG
jgi:hypothetical protein